MEFFFFFWLYSNPLVWNLGSIPITHLVYITLSWKLSTQNLIDTNVHKKEHLRFRGLAFGLCPRTKTRRFFTQNLENTIWWRETQKPKILIHSKLFFHANTKFPLSKQSLELSKKFKTTPKMKRSFVGLISFEKDVLSCTHRI